MAGEFVVHEGEGSDKKELMELVLHHGLRKLPDNLHFVLQRAYVSAVSLVFHP